MNLKVFEYIVAVENYKNFHSAARSCGVSQPALSSAIKAFEVFIGIEIFSRTTRKVIVTTAGAKVIDQIKIIKGEMSALYELANYYKEVIDRPIKIGVDESIARLILPKIIEDLQKRMGQNLPEFYEETTITSKTKLVNYLLDVAIIPKIDLSGSGLISEEVFEDPIYACFPKGHALLEKEIVGLEDIAKQRLVLPKSNHTMYKELLVAGFCIDNGAIEAQTLDGVAMMINSRMGIGFMPASAIIKLTSLDLEFRKIKESPKRSIHMIWRTNEKRTNYLGHIKRIIYGMNLTAKLKQVFL